MKSPSNLEFKDWVINPSYSGGRGKRIAWAQEFESSLRNRERPISKKKRREREREEKRKEKKERKKKDWVVIVSNWGILTSSNGTNRVVARNKRDVKMLYKKPL